MKYLIKLFFITGIIFLFTSSPNAQVKMANVNGVTIAYESLGKTSNDPIILIGGTGSQLIDWTDEFCNELVKQHYRVIRFDNRDAGLSTKFDSAGEPNWPMIIDSLTNGKKPPLAYTIDDMANDVTGLLDVLQIKKANLVGASMGGIIAQIVAATHPERVKSLAVFMSTTGNPSLPPMKPEIQSLILSSPPAPVADTTAIVKRQLKLMKAIGSPGYPTSDSVLEKQIRSELRRNYDPSGVSRQGAAALAAGDRRNEIKLIKAPTLIIHGEADPIVPVEAGRDLAATIPNSKLIIIPGMGHDIPLKLILQFVNEIVKVARLVK